MCYAYKPVVDPASGKIYRIDNKEYCKLEREGKIKSSPDGDYFCRSEVPVILSRSGDLIVLPMRWDLIPRDYQSEYPELPLADLIKRKNSKKTGFEAWNSRAETIRTKSSFRLPWQEGRRAVIATMGFRERPNMDGAPNIGKEYRIDLDDIYLFGCLHETLIRKEGLLDSVTVITHDSMGHMVRDRIYHDRLPLLLTYSQADEWLDPKTSPERAFEMIQQLDGSHMVITEIIKEKKIKSGDSEKLSLF